MYQRKTLSASAALVCICLLPLGICFGQPGKTATTGVGLDTLAWLAGAWTGVSEGTKMEEFWLAPDGNLMVGLHRDVFVSGESFFEYLRIESTADGVTFLASPTGRPPTAFKMVALQDRQVVFANKQHDFPQRIIYRLGSEGHLHARIEGIVDGKLKSREWQWQRIDCTEK